MPTILQFRRGTTAQNDNYTGSVGELTIDTDIDTLRIHDGVNAGGHTMPSLTATQTFTNKTLTSPNLTSPTIGGVAINEYIADTVGAMVTSNTESGISVTYQDADNTLDFDVGDFTITLTGDVTGSGTVTNLGNVSFATTIAANSVALGTDTTGNYVGAGATSGNGISGSVSSEGGTFTVTSNATSSNSANTIVFRDGSGNFSAGVITATTTTARYADLAEKYLADAPYDPGHVVVFGGEHEVTLSTTEYDSRVAGVVSTAPAFVMNEELESILTPTVTVALTGRVPCQVLGPVKKGDVLVTSNMPGVAKVLDPTRAYVPGTVIGKSLQEYPKQEVQIIEIAVGRF